MTVFLNIIYKCIDAFISSWPEFENYATVEVEFLHSRPFMTCHLHFVIVLYAMMGKAHQSVGGVCYKTVILKWDKFLEFTILMTSHLIVHLGNLTY